ncbi:hypothetical protein ACWNYI_00540 [Candidatus Vidania fulgoroideorum]
MIDFKNIKLLKLYLDEFNNIKKRSKKITIREQKKISKCIKISRFLCLIK